MAGTDRISELVARIEGLEAEVRSLRSAGRGPRQEASAPNGEAAVSRRRLLGLAGAATAGAVGSAVLAASPAGATTGNMQFGAANDAGTDNTSLTSTNATTLTLSNGTSTNVPLNLAASSVTGPPNAGTHAVGDVFVDTNGKIHACFQAGTPGGWRGVARIGLNNLDETDNTTVFQSNGAVALACLSGTVGNLAPFRINPSVPTTGAPTANAHQLGEFFVDATGVLFQCVVAGTPGTWVNLTSGNKLILLPSPVRIYDSRPGQPPLAVGPKTLLNVNEDRQIDATLNSSGVPTTASSVLLNLAVTGTVGVGFLGVFKDGIVYPGNANINWSASNQNISNAVTTAVANSAKFRVHCGGNQTNVVLDVIGYYP